MGDGENSGWATDRYTRRQLLVAGAGAAGVGILVATSSEPDLPGYGEQGFGDGGYGR